MNVEKLKKSNKIGWQCSYFHARTQTVQLLLLYIWFQQDWSEDFVARSIETTNFSLEFWSVAQEQQLAETELLLNTENGIAKITLN